MAKRSTRTISPSPVDHPLAVYVPSASLLARTRRPCGLPGDNPARALEGNATMGFAHLPGSHLCLQNTLTSARDVVACVIAKLVGRRAGSWLACHLAQSELAPGRSAIGVDGKTDGLDTLGKLALAASQGAHHAAGSKVFVVVGALDKLIPAHFGPTLAEA